VNNYSILDDINDYLGELGPLEQVNTLEALADWAYAQIDAIRAEEAFLDYEASLEHEGEADDQTAVEAENPFTGEKYFRLPHYCELPAVLPDDYCDLCKQEARDQVINSHAIKITNYPPLSSTPDEAFAERVRQVAYSEYGQYRGDAVL